MILKLKKNLNFVDWEPAGFRCGIVWYKPPLVVPKSGLVLPKRAISILTNNTEIRKSFTRVTDSFDKFINDKHILSTYLEAGIEEC